MLEAMRQLRTRFKHTYEELRRREVTAAELRPGCDDHRAIMSKVFAAEDELFELATLMLCLKEA